jgi:WD40 repeat protein
MTETRGNIPSVVERTRRVAVASPPVAVHFLDATAVFVLGEEALLLADASGETRRVSVHSGAILNSSADVSRLMTGGDDGKVVATNARGEFDILVTDPRRRWIDHVAVGPDHALAWSAGKEAFVRTARGEQRQWEAPSTVGGLAFLPKGFRLAIAHYNGASLWFPNATAVKPDTLAWKGSHLAVTTSPDGRFLVTAMQEPMLHGWRIADRKDMRMSGYSARVRSLGWTADGNWLATSGSNQLVLWPFQGKDGPMGKTPRLLAPTETQIETVACHPAQDIVAVGYANGLMLLVRIDDGAEILARKPTGAPVAALAWNARGTKLAFGTEDGDAGILDLK